jgi:hypothetical protein
MKKQLLIVIFLAITTCSASAQTKPSPVASPRPTPPAQSQPVRSTGFDLVEYGVGFQPDARLIIVMAALEAAGFDPTSEGRQPSVFRSRVRNDLAELNPDLRNRLRSFYQRNLLPAPATAADQAARYVSLAYALGQPPSLEAPERTEDLPAGVLEVLDFLPLLREFYRKSGIDEHVVPYLRAYQAEGDRLRAPAAEMVRAVLSYLHTRPITVSAERVLVKPPTTGKSKKDAPRVYATREHDRHFYIVPDLLAAPAAINLRVIADDYYAIVPEGTDPASSELRRAYLQYVIDPLMLRFNKQIAARREPIRQLLKEREQAGVTVTPDVFLVVARSFVAAADARFDEQVRLQALAIATRNKLAKAKDDAARAEIAKGAQAAFSAMQDDTVAKLADDYERGAVLAFFFTDQLQGIETTGFDVANFFPDMIASFDPAREAKRPAEYAAARARSLAARQARQAKRNEPETPVYSSADAAKAAALVRALGEVEETLRQKDYNGAETRLRALVAEYPREPRVFFALAQTWSVAAADATDEDVQARRLNNALTNYRLAVEAASAETDRALLSRAHEAMGRIHEFLGHREEAVKEFDEAIKIDEVLGGAYKQALEGKKRLTEPK